MTFLLILGSLWLLLFIGFILGLCVCASRPIASPKDN